LLDAVTKLFLLSIAFLFVSLQWEFYVLCLLVYLILKLLVVEEKEKREFSKFLSI